MNDQTPLPAPGWYADPASPETTLRYWDGSDWTEHVHPLQPQAADDAASQETGTAQEHRVETESAADAERATEPAPDVAVPSAEGIAPSRLDAAEASEEPAAAQAGDAPSLAMPATAPWVQGAANPYQQPRAAQHGAQPGAPKSLKGLWIGLGIGGGVFLLLVIGVIVAVAAFFASLRQSIDSAEPGPLPSYDLGRPDDEPSEAPEVDSEVHAMGEAFVVPDPFGGDGGSWEVTITDFSAEAAEAVAAAPGNKGFAVLVEATNLGAEAADPYLGLTPTFVGSDGLEYLDGEQIAPSLYDVDSIDAGATTQFTLTFEVPQDLADGGTVVIYDSYGQASFAVEVG